MAGGLWNKKFGSKGNHRSVLKPMIAYLLVGLIVPMGLAGNVQGEDSAVAGPAESAGGQSFKLRPELEMIFSAGYRSDDLDFNIAGISSSTKEEK